MLTSERQSKIIEILRDQKSASVNELSEHFSVSTETIRRDLRYLEKKNLLSRVYGGAYIGSLVQQTIPASMRKETMRHEKELIAGLCADEINNGDTVLLDSSTTAYYIAKEVMNKKITVITNSIEISYLLSSSKSIELVCAGGRLNYENLGFMDYTALECIEKYFADKAFVSCTGVSIENGLTDSLEMQGKIRKAMLDHSQKNYCIVDHTKIGKTTLSIISPLDQIDCLVTDKRPSYEWVNELSNRKIKCICPESD